ncbi:Imm1 family immunity protein [Saccharopolyspora sp. NFXS83]|uniref:Imm1 family immunity protein n=1 Tax=Saccharopolyspora sp. NFXS83 TaxID=2993560 RepID=UPI00224ADD5B|nr:Imm1 family immunity protein [Saccharopolyspora sp. NFXS83]MCX2730762.1 Imm1 family immunity protein [Saccharopolyspora sp. NFXS83]
MSLSMNESMIHQRELLDLELDDATELIAQIRDADRRRENPDAGLAWFVQFGPDAHEGLVVGIRGTAGAVQWYSATELLQPAHGTNSAPVDYFTGPTGDHYPISPGGEIPIENAFEVLREFAATHRLPGCVEWRADL